MARRKCAVTNFRGEKGGFMYVGVASPAKVTVLFQTRGLRRWWHDRGALTVSGLMPGQRCSVFPLFSPRFFSSKIPRVVIARCPLPPIMHRRHRVELNVRCLFFSASLGCMYVCVCACIVCVYSIALNYVVVP